MPQSEPVRYGRIWQNLPLRIKTAFCYVLPLPVIAVVVGALSYFGFDRLQVALVAIGIELLAGVLTLEWVLRRVLNLKSVTDRIQQGESLVEVRPSSWEMNRVGRNIKSFAAFLREQQQAVQECRSEVTRLFEEAPVAYLETDSQGVVTRANRAAFAVLGRPHDQINGKPVWNVLSSSTGKLVQERVVAQLGDRRPVEAFEQYYVHPDGARLLSVYESLTHDPAGKTAGLRYTLVDITERLKAAETVAKCEEMLRKKNEELSKALAVAAETGQAKTRLLSNVSNDLRVPLNDIVGFAELMFDGKMGVISSDQRECLSDILTGAKNLSTLVDQLVESGQTMQAKRPETPREAVNLEAMICDARYVMQVLTAQKRGISIDLELDPAIREVTADRSRLKQVLTGLLSCAVRMAPNGGRVLLRSIRESASSFRLELCNGSGDGPVLASAEAEATLAHTRQLVEEAGGQYGIRHHAERPSILYAIMPMDTGAVVSKAAQRPPVEAEIPVANPNEEACKAIELVRRSLETLGVTPDKRCKILVVGERIGADRALIAALEHLGYMPFWLRDLKFTLQTAAQEQLSAVIVDLEDKGLLNFEFVLRSLRSVGMSTPVLAFPGQGDSAALGVERPVETPSQKETEPRPRLAAWHGSHKRTA